MVCRSRERAEEARAKIIAEFAEADLPVLLGDCSLEADVRRVWSEFSGREPALHGLCCNAGALLNEKTLTSEGHETTFAAHLLFGAFLLGKLAIDCLKSSGGRLVLVSSGGMYNHSFPEWEVAASLKGEYDGTVFPIGGSYGVAPAALDVRAYV
jgi:NAD(P)-dependent dehydrogenase (short-subunit alcohol dehydrogenase family)